jgi:hypothetical protein
LPQENHPKPVVAEKVLRLLAQSQNCGALTNEPRLFRDFECAQPRFRKHVPLHTLGISLGVIDSRLCSPEGNF